MHGICTALIGKRVRGRGRCACRPRLRPDSVEFDEEMRRPERIGGFARQGKRRGEFPGKERAQGIPGLPGAFEDQLAGSGGDRAGGADRADRASVAQDVANSSPLGGRQLRVCRQSGRSNEVRPPFRNGSGREKAFRANRIFVPSPIRICCAGNARRRCL